MNLHASQAGAYEERSKRVLQRGCNPTDECKTFRWGQNSRHYEINCRVRGQTEGCAAGRDVYMYADRNKSTALRAARP